MMCNYIYESTELLYLDISLTNSRLVRDTISDSSRLFDLIFTSQSNNSINIKDSNMLMYDTLKAHVNMYSSLYTYN
jgi:hypothetical protein